MNFLSTRNIRVLVLVLAIFAIVAFFATSLDSLGSSILRVTPASTGDDVHVGEDYNTLQGTPHKGSEAPYSQTKKPESNVAEVVESKPQKGDKTDKPAAKLAAASGEDCTKYVVMVDAGSTGSRVHVYSFNTCVLPPKLLDEVFEMKKPGLSSFDTDTKGAAASLDSLLDTAVKSVPKDKQGCTPVAVKATAGLRLLGKEKSDAILAEVRSHLEQDYPFAVVDGDGISIMEGLDEGVYAWITTNFLLGNIGGDEKVPTAAVFDLGGGSTQIVFEPEFPNDSELVEDEYKFEFTYGDHKFTLYQFSHLGYGLMQGRNKINAQVVESALKGETSLKKLTKLESKDAKGEVTLTNPCTPPGVTAKDVVVETGDDFYVVNFKGPENPSGAQCRFLAEKILNKEAECKSKPCSFNGVHQPSLTRAFRKSSDMYVFSYFYDRTNPLGFPSSFTVEELTELTKSVCQGNKIWADLFLDDGLKELENEAQWCTDLSFITALIHTGYDIPFHRELRTAKTIDGNELGWCLGASLPLLDGAASGWKCRVENVTP